jgi:hypothetical protein
MGMILTQEVPTGQGELVRVETLPLLVEPSQEFEQAKLMLEQMVKSSGALSNSITTQADYEKGMKILQGLSTFLKNLDEGIKPVKSRINAAKDRVMALQHELDEPAKQLQLALSRETARYKVWAEEQVRLEQERLARAAELERQKKQREMDLSVLRDEVALAQTSANEANARGQVETANEISALIKSLASKLSNPVTASTIANPIQEVTRVRQVVALAIQREQARIAAAAAKAEGDKKTAESILRASAKLEAPPVEEVYVPQVKAEPVVVARGTSYHAPGSHVSSVWRVQSIDDPDLVCRNHPELCVPSESKLNELAKRTKSKPNIPGVRWFEDVRTKGVR